VHKVIAPGNSSRLHISHNPQIQPPTHCTSSAAGEPSNCYCRLVTPQCLCSLLSKSNGRYWPSCNLHFSTCKVSIPEDFLMLNPMEVMHCLLLYYCLGLSANRNCSLATSTAQWTSQPLNPLSSASHLKSVIRYTTSSSYVISL